MKFFKFKARKSQFIFRVPVAASVVVLFWLKVGSSGQWISWRFINPFCGRLVVLRTDGSIYKISRPYPAGRVADVLQLWVNMF